MDIISEYTARYLTTFRYYWYFRPKGFYKILECKSKENEILPSDQFVALSLFLLFFLQTFAFKLNITYAGYFPERLHSMVVEALSAGNTIYLFFALITVSIFYYVISGWWPIHNRQSWARYLQLMCYQTALLIPIYAISVFKECSIFLLYVIGFFTQSTLMNLSITLDIAIIMICGILGIIYEISAVSHVNSVSPARMSSSVVLWTTLVYLFILLVTIFILYIYVTIFR